MRGRGPVMRSPSFDFGREKGPNGPSYDAGVENRTLSMWSASPWVWIVRVWERAQLAAPLPEAKLEYSRGVV